jgi:hypothetical protein
VPDGVASFTCDCATGREVGSSGEDDSGPYAKICAAPLFFWARIDTQDPKAEPVDHQTTGDGEYIL